MASDERRNLANHRGYGRMKRELRGFLPELNADPVRPKSAFAFDPDGCTWQLRR